MRLRGLCFVYCPSSPTTLVRRIPRRGANRTGKLIRSGSCSITGPIGTIQIEHGWTDGAEDNRNTLLAGLDGTKEIRSNPSGVRRSTTMMQLWSPL